MITADKNELLFQSGINFNDLPNWQKRGTGLYWKEYEKHAFNQETKSPVVAMRRRIKRDLDLPMKDEYFVFIARLVAKSLTET